MAGYLAQEHGIVGSGTLPQAELVPRSQLPLPKGLPCPTSGHPGAPLPAPPMASALWLLEHASSCQLLLPRTRGQRRALGRKGGSEAAVAQL